MVARDIKMGGNDYYSMPAVESHKLNLICVYRASWSKTSSSYSFVIHLNLPVG
ncbi:MAG: hypothetical protein ACJAS9_003565, partial [Polaribacter sp.]